MPNNSHSSVKSNFLEAAGEQDYAPEYYVSGSERDDEAKCPDGSLGVGDSLPYGPRMYHGSSEVRMRDIGENNRIVVVGVLGSFTPHCWNRHLFQVLRRLNYFKDKDVDYVCCIATNDSFTHRAWGEYLGCQETVLMWGDSTKRFTKAMGMDVVVPWLDDNVRSMRYVLLADDMVITKMIKAPCDGGRMLWNCEHLAEREGDYGESIWD